MEAPSQEQLKQQISDYYKTHLASGLRCEVKSLSLAEVEETGGKNVTATLSFIHGVTGENEENKVLIPCDDKGNLDWTNTKFLDEDEPHTVDPSQTSHPEVKSPAPLPANNKKPKDGGGQPPERGKYVQKPEKVGAQGGKKIKTGESTKALRPPKRLGGDQDGWPTADDLELEEKKEERRVRSMREGYVHGEDDWQADDLDPIVDAPIGGEDESFDVFEESGVSPALAQQAVASRLGEGLTSPEGYVHGQDLEEDMKGIAPKAVRGEDIPVALVEYRAKSAVEGTETSLFEFGVLFESEEMRDQAKIAVEAMEGVEDVELVEDVGIAVVCRKDADIDNPSAPLSVISESLGVNLIWDEGEKDRYAKDLTEMSQSTHNYSDNKGAYHKGVQTDANEPGAPNPGGDQQSPSDEQGGPKKRKHAKTSGDQGGDGLGGAKAQSTPGVSPDGKEATKQAGQQATEALKEQDFLDDVMAYDTDDDDGEDIGDEVGDVDDLGDEAGGELDDTIMSLVASMAEHGVDAVIEVAREQMGELSPEQEEEIRAMYADAAEGAGDDEEIDVEVTSVEIDAEDDDDDDDDEMGGGNPFESQQEDVNINVNDGGSAEVTASDGADAPAADPAPAAEPAEAPAEEPEAPAEEPAEGDAEPDEGEETKVDDEEKDDDKEPSEKPDKEEALNFLRSEFVDELTEMEEFDAVLEVESLDEEHLLALDEALPPPGEGGRFKKLKKELGDEGAEDTGGLAAYIGRKKYGKKKFNKMAAAGEAKATKKPEKKIEEETPGLHGQSALATGWAAGQPAPNQPLSFVDNDAYSFAQRISTKDPVTRKARVLKPGKFSRTTSRHANMIANRLAKQGFEVDRVDTFDDSHQAQATIGDVDQEMNLGLPEESLIRLSGVRFKREALAKLTDEQKGQMKEKLIARAAKLAEDQQNPNTMGGPKSVQRVRGKEKNYNMFGRIKPGVKWDGMVRVVWDDGDETWEKPGDIQNVGPNPYNVKGPSGGPTKPASNKMSKQGGEELDMLKSLESLKKLPRERRFMRAVELQAEGKKLDLNKLVPILTEGWDEFEEYDSSNLVESIVPKKVEKQPEPKPEPEPIVEEEEEDPGTVNMLVEDFGGETQISSITDLDDE